MTVTDIARDRAFSEIKRLCRASLDTGSLGRATVERLGRVVPFEGYVVNLMDPLSGLPASVAYDEGLYSREEARHLFERIYFEDDVNDYGWMARKHLPVARLSDGTGGKLEHALRHREFNAPKGLGYEMRAVLTEGREMWGGLCLVREKGRPDFDEREMAFIERVAPHLAAGLKAAALRAGAEDGASGEDGAGVLIMDSRGILSRRALNAKRWLRELGASEDTEALPPPVWAVVGVLRRALGRGSDRDLHVIPRLCVRGRSGRWLALQASLTESGDGSLPEIVVMITPAGSGEIARIHANAHGLSEREKEVVDLVLRGASTRNISRALYISESTVQGHLSHIFEKVGVKSRRELLKRLCLDSMA